jgi:peptide/nickel transport system ATP-binding protein
MYRGALVEEGPAERVLAPPHHPYTEALLSAAPRLGAPALERIRLPGAVTAEGPAVGCRFADRCPRKLGAICETVAPPAVAVAEGHVIRCHISAGATGALRSY